MRAFAIVVAIVVPALGGCSGPARATPPSASTVGPGASRRVDGEYLVRIAAGTDPRAIVAAFAPAGVTSMRPVGLDLYLVAVREDPGPERMEELRANDPRILAVQPNFVYRSMR